MRNIHHHFIHHLRSYRTFHFMFFTFLLLIISIVIYFFGDKMYAAQPDLLEQAFEKAFMYETIVDLWAGKNAVGNEILRESIGVQEDLGFGCFVDGQKINGQELKKIICEGKYNGFWDIKNWDVFSNDCIKPDGTKISISNDEKSPFCQNVLWGDWKVEVFVTEAPLIVRIAKFLLRITMVLAVTMVIFNGIMWIIESSKWAEVKDAKKNITLIIVWILIALMSLGIINLISSITISSLG